MLVVVEVLNREVLDGLEENREPFPRSRTLRLELADLFQAHLEATIRTPKIERNLAQLLSSCHIKFPRACAGRRRKASRLAEFRTSYIKSVAFFQ